MAYYVPNMDLIVFFSIFSEKKLQLKSYYFRMPYWVFELQVDEEKKGSTVQEGSKALTRTSSGENLDHELVYHTDYHGVTTHPTPTPKHPKP